MQKKSKIPNGFTLVEILVSITLLGIILITFIPFFAQFANFVKISENNLTAINFAEKVEYNLKEYPGSIPLPKYVSCEAPQRFTMADINEYVRQEIQSEVNEVNYYPEIYVCQPNQQERLYQARIEIFTNTNRVGRKYLTHIYTYLKSDQNE